ncbi:protein PALE CRESS, chloroplastic isoform X2 [Macadamia integrifolia]|uniref:protein PALE CRESS, chloroplastic isoform X2 n=1 Tax=Macadamia integrifolia TaxID=60698 RepID=UPI001C4F66CA|nr:protein PALE CRESS, chloroplastic isoform X2 [Macadamia integrifolia]
MEAKVFMIACPTIPSPASVLTRTQLAPNPNPRAFRTKFQHRSVTRRNKNMEEQDLYGLPKEYYDDEWQAQQREKTKELHRRRQKEDEEEERKVEEYREIGTRLMEYPEEEVRKARILVASFIRAAEEVEEKIEEAAEKGELTELVLKVIWNRLDLARRDEERDAVRSLDLLYRRVEHHGQLRLPPEPDNVLLRVDFVREVDALLQEVRSEPSLEQTTQGLDPDSVAGRLKQQERQRTIRQVEALLDLAVTLKW